MKGIYSPGPLDDADEWTNEDYEAYSAHCKREEELMKKQKALIERVVDELETKNTEIKKCLDCKHCVNDFGHIAYCNKYNNFAPVDECEKEENTMGTKKSVKVVTKNAKKVNTEVKENKEEKKMTKVNNIASIIAAKRNAMEAETGKSFAIGEQTPDKFACKDNVGMNIKVLKSLDLKDVKYNAKKAEEPPKFMKRLELTLEDEEAPVVINYNMFLYYGDVKQEVDVFDAIVTAKGDEGHYITVNAKAYDKKVEELTEEDIEFHELYEGERIWIPGKKELKALSKQLGLAKIEFDDEGHALIPEQEIVLYVYEDAVKHKIVKAKKGDIAKYQSIEFFYNASFIAPEDVHNMKYGRRFTTSEDAAHRAELAELPGVVRYLESC